MKNIFYIVIVILVACGSCKNKVSNKSLVQKQMFRVSDRYKANPSIDTVNLMFTYQLQDILQGDSVFIVRDLEIADIRRDDSLLVLVLFYERDDVKFLLELNCTEQQFLKISGVLPINFAETVDLIKPHFVIFKLEDFKKSKLKVTSEIEASEDDAYSYILVQSPEMFFIKGNLIDLIEIDQSE